MLRAIALHDRVTKANDGLSDLYHARNQGVKIRIIKSQQALSKRLACLPADLFGQVFELTIASWYTKNSTAHDQNWTEQLLERLPIGGLLTFDARIF